MCTKAQVWRTTLRFLFTRQVLEEEIEYMIEGLSGIKQRSPYHYPPHLRGRQIVGRNPTCATIGTGKDLEREGPRDGQGCAHHLATSFLKDFIYSFMRDTERGAEAQAEREQAPQRSLMRDLIPGPQGPRPGQKRGAQLLSHPGIPTGLS